MRLQLPRPFGRSDEQAQSKTPDSHSDKLAQRDTSTEVAAADESVYAFVEAASKDEEPIIPHPSVFEGLANFDSENVDKLKEQLLDGFPSVGHCAVHLLLLEIFWRLRQDVIHKGDLDAVLGRMKIDDDDDDAAAAQAEREADRRWRAYVELGVGRFERWQNKVSAELKQMVQWPKPQVELPAIDLPPLDVLMVWHAYTLNPRCYYEDCLRYDKLEFWYACFPWKAVHAVIDQRHMTYHPGQDVVQHWAQQHAEPFDLYKEMRDGAAALSEGTLCERKILQCNKCSNRLRVPITDAETRKGFVDDNFETTCDECENKTTKDALCLHSLQHDLIIMKNGGRVMRGMALDKDGHKTDFRNTPLMEFIAENPTLEVPVIKDKTSLEGGAAWVKSHYIDNPSSIFFSLDLASAVIRQGGFIDKMHNFLWIRSPSLSGTLARAIARYEKFFHLLKTYPKDVMVPCLDVDIVWHTQQTFASRYYNYSITHTSNVFIDHDDKIAKDGLDTSWDKTKEVWKLEFGGSDNEMTGYGRCLCWDCEIVRDRGESEFVWYKGKKRQEKERGEEEKMTLAYYRAVEEARLSGRTLPAWE